MSADAALALAAGGLSVIPIRLDGSKRPAMKSWKPAMERAMGADEIRANFGRGERGIAIVTGAVSGLEVLDLDDRELFDRWRSDPRVPKDLEKFAAIVRTPAGWHIYLRRDKPAPGRKVARDAAGGCLAETRGEGNYVVAPGSPPAVHPLRIPYEQVAGPSIAALRALPQIPDELYEALIAAAASLGAPASGANGHETPPRPRPERIRPGDDLEVRASWGDLLCPAGWKLVGGTEEEGFWQKPGHVGPAREHHATTGNVRGEDGTGRFHAFSTAAPPFEEGANYSKFAALALLRHGGDFSAAARALSAQGFGSSGPFPRPETVAAVRAARESGPATGRFSDENVEALASGNPKFLKTWVRSRPDFAAEHRDKTLERYLFSLVWHARHFSFDVPAIAGLVTRWSRKHDLPEFPDEEVAAAIDSVFASATTSDEDCVANVEAEALVREAEESPDPTATYLAHLEKVLGLPIAAWLQSEPEDPRFVLVLTDGSRIEIGKVAAVQSSHRFEGAVYSATGRLLPPAAQKPAAWRRVLACLGRIRRIETPDQRSADDTIESVNAYLRVSPTFSDQGEAGWEGALECNYPFRRDGRVFIHAGHFARYLRAESGQVISIEATRSQLRNAGFSRSSITARGQNGTKSIGRRYWSISEAALDVDGADGDSRVSTGGGSETVDSPHTADRSAAAGETIGKRVREPGEEG